MSARPPRVLMLLHGVLRTDARVLKQAAALAESGAIVSVLSLDSRRQRAAVSERVVSVTLGREDKFGQRESPRDFIVSWMSFCAAAIWFIAVETVRSGLPRAVVAHNMPNFIVLCAAPLRLLGVRVILDLHDCMEDVLLARRPQASRAVRSILRLEEWISVRSATVVMTVNRPIAKFFERRAARRPEVIHNAPDAARGLVVPRERLRECSVFGVHGHVHERYGIHRVFPVLRRLAASGIDVHLKVMGDGPFLPELRDRARADGVAELVSFSGSFSPDELPDLLSGVDVGLALYPDSSFASRLLPVKVLEYATFGVPVVASRMESLEQYFPADSVLYFTTDEELETCLRTCVEDYAGALDRAVQARQVVESISWENEKRAYIRHVLGHPDDFQHG